MDITGKSNPNIKTLRALYNDKKYRYECGEYVVEGVTAVKDLPVENVKRVFIREDEWENLKGLFPSVPTYCVRKEIFDGVADTKTPSGLIAVAKMPRPKAVFGETVLLLCGVSDAGNVGSLIRTAAARGVETVICAGTADPYSPKTVRAGMGGHNYVNIVTSSDASEALKLIPEYKIAVLDMYGISIYGYRKVGKTAIALGNEAHGVPQEIKSRADIKLALPMKQGTVESLNVACAGTAALYLLN